MSNKNITVKVPTVDVLEKQSMYDHAFVITTAKLDPLHIPLLIKSPKIHAPHEVDGASTSAATAPPPSELEKLLEEMYPETPQAATTEPIVVSTEEPTTQDVVSTEELADAAVVPDGVHTEDPLTDTDGPIVAEPPAEEDPYVAEKKRKADLARQLLTGRETFDGEGHVFHRVGCNCPQERTWGQYSIPQKDHINRRPLEANFLLVLRASGVYPYKQGVFAVEDIPAGFAICKYDSQVINYLQDGQVQNRRDFFASYDGKETFNALERIALAYKGDPARPVNSRFYVDSHGDCYLQAMRPIIVGEEITHIAGIVTFLASLFELILTAHDIQPTPRTSMRLKALIDFITRKFLKKPDRYINSMATSTDNLRYVRNMLRRMEDALKEQLQEDAACEAEAQARLNEEEKSGNGADAKGVRPVRNKGGKRNKSNRRR